MNSNNSAKIFSPTKIFWQIRGALNAQKKPEAQKPSLKAPETARVTQRWIWVLLGLVLLFVVAVRVRLLPVPLERDEGEFAYVGQLMLDGIAPFKTAYIIKPPGIYAAYALIMALFGQTPSGIHLGLLLVNIAAILLLFVVAKRWFDTRAALIAATTFALLSLSQEMLGSAAHATQFVIAAALAGILFLQIALESQRKLLLFASGALFGLGFIFKQPGLVFGAFGGLLLLLKEFQTRPIHWRGMIARSTIFSFGFVLPFAMQCLLLWRAGVFGKFWEWNVTRAGGRWVPLQYVWLKLNENCHFGTDAFFWIAGALALVFIFFARAKFANKSVLLVFLLFSILGVIPGFNFNRHYFIVALPALGLLIGVGAVETGERFRKWRLGFLPATIFVAICVTVIFSQRDYLFRQTPTEVVTKLYRNNPFVQAIEVADFIKKNSKPDTSMVVLGSEPEIYFYAHRRGVTGHVSTYMLMERGDYALEMQREMIREIENGRPEWFVFISEPLSWAPNKYSDQTIFEWFDKYWPQHYQLAGLVHMIKPGETVYRWGKDAETYKPNSDRFLLVLKRK